MELSDTKLKRLQNSALAVALITNFVLPFAASSLNIAVPHIGKEFHASATSLTWIVLAFIFTTALLSIPFGRIADIRGRQPVLKTGILLVCLSAVLNIFSPNMAIFLLFRVLQGVGAAMIFATNVAVVIDVFPAEKRGSVLGVMSAAVYTGAAAGPVVGGFVTHRFGWQSIFVIVSVLAFIAFIMALARLPKEEKTRTSAPEKINTASIALFIISLGLLMYGFATLTQNLWSYFILAAGIVMIVVFVRHESRTKTPVIEVRLFVGNPEFTLSNLAALVNYASIFAITYLMSLYLQLVKGLSADLSGLVMISQPLMQTILSPIAGRLSDRKPPYIIASLGMACCVGALVLFAFTDEQTSLPTIIAGLFLVGFGMGLFASPNSNVILGAVARKDYSIASSVLSTARTIGQVSGMAALTIIINVVIGNVPIEDVAPALIVRDMHISFSIFAALCIVGVFISLQRRTKTSVRA